jgi:hypothetical protein
MQQWSELRRYGPALINGNSIRARRKLNVLCFILLAYFLQFEICVIYLLKSVIEKPEEAADTTQWLCKHVSTANKSRDQSKRG